MGHDLSLLVVLAGGAAAIPFAARRLRIPSAVAEIIYGSAVFGFFIRSSPEWFHFLKELGLIYLMFVAGMELDLRKLMRSGRFPWYLAMAILPFAVMPALFAWGGLPYYLGIAVAVMSAGIVIPVLKEGGLMKSPEGEAAVGLSLTGEFVSIAVIAAVDIYNRHGVTPQAGLSVLKIAFLFTAAFFFLRLMYLAAWWAPEKVVKVMESEDPVEEGIRAVVFIAFAGALMALGAGVEPILGSFLAGVIFTYVFKSKGKFEEKINAVGFGFFIPMFFFGVGADFDPRTLASASGVGFAVFLAIMVVAGNLHVILFSSGMRIARSGAASVAVLVSAPLTLMVVAGTLGVRAGLLGHRHFDALVLASVLAGIICPTVFRLMSKRPEEKESGPQQAG